MPTPPSPFPPLAIAVALQDDADAQELDTAARALRDELLLLDVDAVERVPAGAVPEGARAVEASVLAAMAVQLGQATLGAVLGTIRDWVGRGTGRSVKLSIDGDTIELSRVSGDEQRELVAAFLARHGADGPPP
ncbi:effector-associated constant component EACC1 [Baekduia sp. Peel2402]|uniref:effector-associated constant component EACC1 n=1 Tax=Baekduia sp. Peel2402 TaxID=3458296 RepID=UPI00403E9DD6